MTTNHSLPRKKTIKSLGIKVGWKKRSAVEKIDLKCFGFRSFSGHGGWAGWVRLFGSCSFKTQRCHVVGIWALRTVWLHNNMFFTLACFPRWVRKRTHERKKVNKLRRKRRLRVRFGRQQSIGNLCSLTSHMHAGCNFGLTLLGEYTLRKQYARSRRGFLFNYSHAKLLRSERNKSHSGFARMNQWRPAWKYAACMEKTSFGSHILKLKEPRHSFGKAYEEKKSLSQTSHEEIEMTIEDIKKRSERKSVVFFLQTEKINGFHTDVPSRDKSNRT